MSRPLRALLRDPLKVAFLAVLIGVVIILEAVLLLRPRAPQVAATPPTLPAASVPAVPQPVPAPAPKPAPRETPTFRPLPAETPSAPAPVLTPAPAPPPASAMVPEAKPAPRVEPPAAKPEAQKTEVAKPAPRKSEPVRPAPPRIVEPPPETRPAPAPPPEPVETKPRPAPSQAAVPVSRAAVEFPIAAYAKNIESGIVKARLTINADGHVTAVQILEARPRRYFDEEAMRSLKLWRFNAGADNRSYDVEIAFQR